MRKGGGMTTWRMPPALRTVTRFLPHLPKPSIAMIVRSEVEVVQACAKPQIKRRFRLFWRLEVTAEVDPTHAFATAQEIRLVGPGSTRFAGCLDPKRPAGKVGEPIVRPAGVLRSCVVHRR